MIEQTLTIIKPDATRRNLIGAILARIEQAGFRVAALKMLHLNAEQTTGFYAEHQGKEFFAPLIEFMTSAPVVVAVLEKENAIADFRELAGATDSAQRKAGTIRAEFALSKTENSVHSSDSPESATREIAYYFTKSEIF